MPRIAVASRPQRPADQRELVEQLLSAYTQTQSPEPLVEAARLSEACNLVLATLAASSSDSDAGLRGEEGSAQRHAAYRLVAGCGGFETRPISNEQVAAWYIQASRAGNVKALARLVALRKGFGTEEEVRDAMQYVLAAAVPDTYPELGNALKHWSGRAIVAGEDVATSVYDAAWQLAGCGDAPCGQDTFKLAYNCSLAGLCGATTTIAYLQQGGLAPQDVQEATRLADVIKAAIARGDYVSLGFGELPAKAAR